MRSSRRVSTSETDPIRVAEVKIRSDLGLVGVTFAPGKRDPAGISAVWDRSLGQDLDVIRDWGAEQVVTLLEPHEFGLLHIEELGAEVRGRGMGWVHLPIRDVSIPARKFERRWDQSWPLLRETLMRRGNVLVHCRGGLGRAGMVAARILVEMGVTPSEAMARVREVRPGAIETAQQERYVEGLG